jgi:exonuclease SbcD
LLFIADTHLGFDQPVRPRVNRRRRGADFFANFRRALEAAVADGVDLVVHGGDLFFRSRVPDAIVDRVYEELMEFAEHGIPLVIVPGNHERSRLPTSLLLEHPGIHVFDSPSTILLELAGATVALSGFPSVRKNIRARFPELVSATLWDEAPADIRLLCFHQTVEGSTVGPAGYTFRGGHDVIRQRDLPEGFHAILAGHIHRHQILRVRKDGGIPTPVIYPGATERTSFAEAREEKGYCVLEFAPTGGRWALGRTGFVGLPTRPMVTVELPDALRPDGVGGFLSEISEQAPPDAILRFTCSRSVSAETRWAFRTVRLTECLSDGQSYQFGAGFFGERGGIAAGHEPTRPHRS